MAVTTFMDNANMKDTAENQSIHRTGKYEYRNTKYEGIKEVTSSQGGYLVFLDYGRKQKLDKNLSTNLIFQ